VLAPSLLALLNDVYELSRKYCRFKDFIGVFRVKDTFCRGFVC
jgi:hypothetical protein